LFVCSLFSLTNVVWNLVKYCCLCMHDSYIYGSIFLFTFVLPLCRMTHLYCLIAWSPLYVRLIWVLAFVLYTYFCCQLDKCSQHTRGTKLIRLLYVIGQLDGEWISIYQYSASSHQTKRHIFFSFFFTIVKSIRSVFRNLFYIMTRRNLNNSVHIHLHQNFFYYYYVVFQNVDFSSFSTPYIWIFFISS